MICSYKPWTTIITAALYISIITTTKGNMVNEEKYSPKPQHTHGTFGTGFKSKSTHCLKSVPRDSIYHGSPDATACVAPADDTVDDDYVFIEDCTKTEKKAQKVRDLPSKMVERGQASPSIEACHMFTEQSLQLSSLGNIKRAKDEHCGNMRPSDDDQGSVD